MTTSNTQLSRTVADPAVAFRRPERADGVRCWELVKESSGLEPNTAYAYLLLCTHFAETCVVAEREGEVIGFVAAYRPPARQDTVFVWQIGVREDARGLGLGRQMLHRVFDAPACEHVRFLEATVAPSNEASRGLFGSFARERNALCEVKDGFLAHDFAPLAHEAEELFRIGPIEKNA